MNKKISDRGRILVRVSGTENKLRVLVESLDEQEGKDIFDEINKFISSEVS